MSQAPSSPQQQCDKEQQQQQHHTVVIATRIHLGKATAPPTHLEQTMRSFWAFARHQSSSSLSAIPVIAVEAENRIPGYNLLQEIESIVEKLEKEQPKNSSAADAHDNVGTTTTASTTAAMSNRIHLVPVQPWNHFTPALNALVQFATQQTATALLLCSVETTTTTVQTTAIVPRLLSHLLLRKRSHGTSSGGGSDTDDEEEEDTLVVGAVLPGHEFSPPSAADEAEGHATAGATKTDRATTTQPTKTFTVVPLTGRTCPWNTLALWNVRLLARTGFPLVADTPGIGGIEEVATVALQQRLYGTTTTVVRAKLVPIPGGVTWDTDQWTDPARIAWHQQKMESKNTRATAQLHLLGMDGHDGVLGVEHYHH